jgi:hypothetical protein
MKDWLRKEKYGKRPKYFDEEIYLIIYKRRTSAIGEMDEFREEFKNLNNLKEYFNKQVKANDPKEVKVYKIKKEFSDITSELEL